MVPDDGERVRPGTAGWSVVVPVKQRDAAKTRLGGAAGRRAELALAFAEDTVEAALQSVEVREVLVVTDDVAVARAAGSAGAVVVPEPGTSGLNAALHHGAAEARRRRPGCAVAALLADLPALTGDVLSRALRAATAHPTSFVPDADGFGTTLYAAAAGAQFTPSFGGASRERHRRGGAHELDGELLDRLRTDVDTEDDLAAAARLGLGPHTRRLVPAADVP